MTRRRARSTGEYLASRINANGNDGRAAVLAGQISRNREARRTAGVVRLATRTRGCGCELVECIG